MSDKQTEPTTPRQQTMREPKIIGSAIFGYPRWTRKQIDAIKARNVPIMERTLMEMDAIIALAQRDSDNEMFRHFIK